MQYTYANKCITIKNEQKYSTGIDKSIIISEINVVLLEDKKGGRMIEEAYFSSSLKLEGHPVRKARQKTKNEYYYSLEYIVDRLGVTSEHTRNCMKIYKKFFLLENVATDKRASYESIVLCRNQPWRNKYRYWIICDLALILRDEAAIGAVELMKTEISARQGQILDDIVKTLNSQNRKLAKPLLPAKDLVDQYRINQRFGRTEERRVIVTANISAGKSTMINALIGQNIARTAMEACTGNLCYFYNKPFDDSRIHFKGRETEYCFIDEKEAKFDWTEAVAYALPFKTIQPLNKRFCIIDTPGVNSKLHEEHKGITRKCIQEEAFDSIYYVFNAGKLGTDGEDAHLRWISNHVPQEKVIFVLNKLDTFHASEDSIRSSIEGVRNDLKAFGYEQPQIFPVSSYYAYLIKQKMQGTALDCDEEDEYELLSQKYSRKEHDLSVFYEDDSTSDNEFVEQLKRSGFYYLEKNVYGGTL